MEHKERYILVENYPWEIKIIAKIIVNEEKLSISLLIKKFI